MIVHRSNLTHLQRVRKLKYIQSEHPDQALEEAEDLLRDLTHDQRLFQALLGETLDRELQLLIHIIYDICRSQASLQASTRARNIIVSALGVWSGNIRYIRSHKSAKPA